MLSAVLMNIIITMLTWQGNNKLHDTVAKHKTIILYSGSSLIQTILICTFTFTHLEHTPWNRAVQISEGPLYFILGWSELKNVSTTLMHEPIFKSNVAHLDYTTLITVCVQVRQNDFFVRNLDSPTTSVSIVDNYLSSCYTKTGLVVWNQR